MCATTKPRFATIRRLKEAGAPSTSSRIPSPCATSTTAKSEPCSVSTPQRLELAHFLDCVASRRTPLTDGESAVARRSPSKQAPCASAALCVLAFESKPRKPQTPNSKRRSPQPTLSLLAPRPPFASLRLNRSPQTHKPQFQNDEPADSGPGNTCSSSDGERDSGCHGKGRFWGARWKHTTSSNGRYSWPRGTTPRRSPTFVACFCGPAMDLPRFVRAIVCKSQTTSLGALGRSTVVGVWRLLSSKKSCSAI